MTLGTAPVGVVAAIDADPGLARIREALDLPEVGPDGQSRQHGQMSGLG